MEKIASTHMRVELASESDSEQLKKFLAENSMPGLLKLSIERQSSFFNKYRVLSDDFVTYKMVDLNNNIAGMASLIFQEVVIEGERQNIAFAADLRIQRKRKALSCWEENFLPILQAEKEKRQTKYVFSTVAKSHVQAYNAFIRPRSVHRNFPRYHMFRRFNLVSLHGVYPWAPKPLDSITIEPMIANGVEELQNYIKKHQLSRPFYFPSKSEQLMDLMTHWPGLGVDSFLIARDNQKNIVGCCCLWDPNQVEKYKVVKKSKRVRTFENTLKGLSLFGMTRPLYYPKSKYLNFKQLNFVYSDNPDIFYSLLHHCFNSISKYEFLTYLHFENQMNYLPPKGFISYGSPYGMYCMISPEDPTPGFIKPSFMENSPDLELAYI